LQWNRNLKSRELSRCCVPLYIDLTTQHAIQSTSPNASTARIPITVAGLTMIGV
jgi:hypothetical protein